MMKIKSFLFLVSALLLFASCNQGNNEPMKPSSAGAPGDLLLVINDNIWQAAAGDTLSSMLAAPVDALPQNEPLFNVIRVKHRNFDKNFKQQRNIVIVKVGPDQVESKIVVQKGLWAKSQVLIGIQATDQNELIKLLNDNREEIVSVLLDAERKRLMAAYHKSLDPIISKKLREEHNIILTVPKGFQIDVEEENFLWLAQEYRDIVQGILIYKYPYTDKETFTPEYLLEKRNRIVKEYVPGEQEGSYMTTEPLLTPLFREYELRSEKYTAELRGLWKMEGGMPMGGPFISITQLDNTGTTVVTLDAFVFAPGHDKRELIRQLEAIILSLDFVSEEKVED